MFLEDRTLDCLNALAEALLDAPEDAKNLNLFYNHFSEILADVMEDYFPEENETDV